MGPDDFPLPRHVGSADLPSGWERLLLARISAGDGDALLELRWRWGEWICGRVYRVTCDWMAASLLTSGVFVRLWRDPADFDPGGLRHSLLSLAEQRAHQWMASTAEDIDMSGMQERPIGQFAQEKSTTSTCRVVAVDQRVRGTPVGLEEHASGGRRARR
jgi:hypothetical protein